MSEKILKKSLYVLLAILGTVILFQVLHMAATFERGYEAVGGELCVLFLPLVYIVIKNW